MRRGNNLRYLIVPLGFTLLAAVLAAAFLRPFLKVAAAEWKAVWVMNGPEYEYEENKLFIGEGQKENWQEDLTVGKQ